MNGLDYVIQGTRMSGGDVVSKQLEDLLDALCYLNSEHGGDEYPSKPLVGNTVATDVETLNRVLASYRELIN